MSGQKRNNDCKMIRYVRCQQLSSCFGDFRTTAEVMCPVLCGAPYRSTFSLRKVCSRVVAINCRLYLPKLSDLVGRFKDKSNKMLSYRRETALQDALQFSPKVEDWNWETIFYGYYRSIFNHCDIIGRKICRIS